MDPLVLGIIGLFVALLVTIGLLLVYTGVLTEIDVKTGKPPIASVRVSYKFANGPYSDCGALFAEVVSLVPKLRTIAVYYDDPKKVEPSDQRYIVGAILAEGDSKVDTEAEAILSEKEFKIVTFPAVDHAVITTFPYIWAFSIYIATAKVWPRLGQYIEERKLCAHPSIEICTGDQIQYMIPLSKQEEFYVEEAKRAKAEKLSLSDETPEGDTLIAESTPHDSTMSSQSGEGSSGSESSFEEINYKEGEAETS